MAVHQLDFIAGVLEHILSQLPVHMGPKLMIIILIYILLLVILPILLKVPVYVWKVLLFYLIGYIVIL